MSQTTLSATALQAPSMPSSRAAERTGWGTRLFRLVSGVALVGVLLVAAFSLVIVPAIGAWGATPAEVARTYQGDELLAKPVILWTHGATIRAKPDAVWPWIAQIGDDRGGFYSYTFIENLYTGSDVYHNANRIIPELQNPQPGEGLIADFLNVQAVDSGRSMLGATPEGDLGWTWLWSVEPAGQEATRLLVRCRIQPGGDAGGAVMGFVMNVGGFVMERRMIQGIVDRAEGRFDTPYREGAEIALWFAALVAGLVAGYFFVVRRAWLFPLGVGVAAVLALLFFTFVQPSLWLRVAIDAALLAGVWWGRR